MCRLNSNSRMSVTPLAIAERPLVPGGGDPARFQLPIPALLAEVGREPHFQALCQMVSNCYIDDITSILQGGGGISTIYIIF